MKQVGRTMAVLVVLGGIVATDAMAQTQPRDPNMPDPKNVPAEKVAPDIGGSTGSGDTLSDRLQRTEGVIKPPATSTPDMTVTPPVPNPGTTPVIPPPGMSPSDPVQPK